MFSRIFSPALAGMLLLPAAPMLADQKPTAPPPTPAAPRPMTFGGPVLEVSGGKRQEWFVMKGGGSRRYARVKVLHDPKATWGGLPRPGKTLKVGDFVRVDVLGDANGIFRARHITVQDPNERPAERKAGSAR